MASLMHFFRLIVILLLLWQFPVFAQNTVIVLHETGESKPIKSRSISSLASAQKEISNTLNEYYRLGYLAASIDSMRETNDTLANLLDKSTCRERLPLSFAKRV